MQINNREWITGEPALVSLPTTATPVAVESVTENNSSEEFEI
jgi:hypothetical protein